VFPFVNPEKSTQEKLMKFSIVHCLVALGLTSFLGLSLGSSLNQASAQESRKLDLSYRFFDQQINLVERPDQRAVQLKSTVNTRLLKPAFIQLQEALAGTPAGSRNPKPQDPLAVEVRPLGNNFALLQLPATRARGFEDNLTQRLQQDFVQATLPVLQRQGTDGQGESVIVNDELVISVEPGTSAADLKTLLTRYGLETVRPLRFSKNRYLVRSKTETGIAILGLSNRLAGVSGIQSASPNFIQVLSYQPRGSNGVGQVNPAPQSATNLQTLKELVSRSRAKGPFSGSLLPLQWHLDSRGRSKQAMVRTDVRAVEAWDKSREGKGVLVAVIDSLIQWDHPDLNATVYEVPSDTPGLLPGEKQGWDFSGNSQTCGVSGQAQSCVMGDPDTRISDAELAVMLPYFQNTFTRSNEQILSTYQRMAEAIRSRNPKMPAREVARIIRAYIQGDIAGEFHGTWSAGVVAAQPGAPVGSPTSGGTIAASQTPEGGRFGAVGVAPRAKILPVRVFAVGGSLNSTALIDAVGYAAERGVDVINMSLGGLLPNQALVDQIFAVLDANPKLTIVASAGNESLDGVGFPAAIPGVISVGATNLEGQRSPYSSFGGRLDLVAPGGDTSLRQAGGILTTGGTFLPGFWRGIEAPKYAWGPALDPLGQYVQVQGTSFSAPAVAGVVALMKGADPERRLTREQIIRILAETASYGPLKVTQADANRYRLNSAVGFGTVKDFSFVRPSGVEKRPEVVSSEQYYFGKGLVNAAAAVAAVQQVLGTP
jgi:serine protease